MHVHHQACVSCVFVVHRCPRTRHQTAASVTDSHQTAGNNSPCLSLHLPLCFWLSSFVLLMRVCLFCRTKPRLSLRKWRSFLRSTTKWYTYILTRWCLFSVIYIDFCWNRTSPIKHRLLIGRCSCCLSSSHSGMRRWGRWKRPKASGQWSS